MAKNVDDLPAVQTINWRDRDEDPHEAIAELRRQAPLARTEPMRIIMCLRYAHAEIVLNEANTRQLETETKLMQGVSSGPIFEFVRDAMLFANGEAHQRRRRPIARTFAYKLMEAMRPKARALAEEMIAERKGADAFEFVDGFSAQIPARIIADVLGIPRSDLPVFSQWVQSAAAALGFIDLERRAEIEANMTAFNDYVAGLLADRRASPRDDFLSAYVADVAAAGDLTEGEIRTQVLGLILAGADTTRGSLCLILDGLHRHPAEWARLCADPEGLKRAAVEEGLRYDPIVSAIPRVAVRPFEVDGYEIPAGQIIAVSVLAAQRDPDVFADPNAFRIDRADHPRWNLGFGAGAHRCAGEALARVELEETLAAIATLAPNMEIERRPLVESGAIRVVSGMRVRFP